MVEDYISKWIKISCWYFWIICKGIALVAVIILLFKAINITITPSEDFRACVKFETTG